MTIYNNYKGLVLAAGFGTRLKPLTDFIPKPALPLFNTSVLDLAISKLNKAGINSIAVNSHHLPEQISNIVNSLPYKDQITISYEPDILGTGGVHNPLKSWRDNKYLMIYNSDIVSDIDLTALADSHEKSNAISTMALLPFPQKNKTIVYVKGNNIVSIGEEPQDKTDIKECSFTAVSIVTEELLNFLPDIGFSNIIDAYRQAFKQGLKINAYFHSGYWFDIGTPKDYFDVHCKLSHSFTQFIDDGLNRIKSNSSNVVLGENVFVLGRNCVINQNCHIQNCILIDDVTIQPNTHVSSAILYKDLVIPFE